MDREKIALFACAWFLAASAGLCFWSSERKYKSIGHLFSLAAVSGFVGFSVVGYLHSNYGGSNSDVGFLLACAAAAGLSGKSGIQIITLMYSKTLGRLLNEENEDKDK